MLYLCKRARPDMQTAIAFLCTRVKQPDVDDWKKLARAIRYLRGTKDLGLTLEADGSGIIKWWIDASFAVHQDMHSHSGITMSLGKGSPYSSSTRQRLNTKSSTEAELVGVDDGMSSITWTRRFLVEQGVHITDTVVYQDNQSAMLLERNGRASSGRRTRHISIKYFFVTDRVKGGELRVEYCPTDDMWETSSQNHYKDQSFGACTPRSSTLMRPFRCRQPQLSCLAHRSVLGNRAPAGRT